jgi:hypothetical protein
LSVTRVQDAADWIEFQAIIKPGKMFFFSDIKRMLGGEGDAGTSDYDQEDSEDEDISSQWANELQMRKQVLQDAYPFEISRKGIRFIALTNQSYGGYAYLLCLFLSHPKDGDVIDGKGFLNIGKNDPARNLFQVISTIAAGGYIRGSSISFGWPRQDGTNFENAIKRLCKHTQDAARIKKQPDPGAPNQIKDYEIDIVSWIPTNDNLPSKVFFVSQVASGADWKSKRLRNEIIADLWPWVEVPFSSMGQVTTGLFIPFCIYQEKNATMAETLRYLSASFLKNILFHRLRVPFYVHEVFTKNLYELEGLLIERTDEFQDVMDWVNDKLSVIS